MLRCSTTSVFSHPEMGIFHILKILGMVIIKTILCQIQLDVYHYTLEAVALCPQEAIYSILLELFFVAAVI
jgi:hypothetical protein